MNCVRMQMRKLAWIGLWALIASGCVRFQPRPVSAPRALEDFEARRLDAPAVTAFFASRPEVGAWPPAGWDLRALTLAALYYSPSLDVARARWGVAQAGRITAGERPNPTGNF